MPVKMPTGKPLHPKDLHPVSPGPNPGAGQPMGAGKSFTHLSEHLAKTPHVTPGQGVNGAPSHGGGGGLPSTGSGKTAPAKGGGKTAPAKGGGKAFPGAAPPFTKNKHP